MSFKSFRKDLGQTWTNDAPVVVMTICYYIGIPALMLLILFGVNSPEYREKVERQQIALDHLLNVDRDVASCMQTRSSWQCFVAMETLDRTTPAPFGISRTRRVAAVAPAHELISLCLEPRKVDCANRMIGHGYSREDVLAALND